jgi:hypothetical protein
MSSPYRWLANRIVVIHILLLGILLLLISFLDPATFLPSSYGAITNVFASGDSSRMNSDHRPRGLRASSRHSPPNQQCLKTAPSLESMAFSKTRNDPSHIFRGSGRGAIGALLIVAVLVAPKR